MSVPTGHLTITTARQPVASAFTAYAELKNTGNATARVVTEPGNADHGRTIAPGATLKIKPQGRTIFLVADAETTVEITKWSTQDLREAAAKDFGVPLELLRGERTPADILGFIARLRGEVAE